MFTGLIKDIGIVKSKSSTAEGAKFIIETKLASEISIDDSVAVNGVCQTATEVGSNYFVMDTVHVSLEKTTLKNLNSGDCVNLELALKASDRLGGHFVQGHVNGEAKVVSIDNVGSNYQIKFELPPSQRKYVVQEGSITLNGVSLTVSDYKRDSGIAAVSIIPHTFENTTFKYLKSGNLINVEVDILAKYLESLIFCGDKHKYEQGFVEESKITEDWLRSKGF